MEDLKKYKLTIKQSFEYTESLIAEFSDIDELLSFAETIMNTCEKVKCIIERIENDEE